MASQTDQIFTDPMGKIRELEAQKVIDNRISRASGVLDGIAKNVVELEFTPNETIAELALGRAEAEGIPQNQITGAARILYKRMKVDRDKRLHANRVALSQAIEKGGGDYSIEDTLMSPKQREAIAASRPWKRSQTQAMLALAQEASPIRRANVFSGIYSPADKKRLQELLDEELIGQGPTRDRGIGGTLAYGLQTLGRAVTGGIAGAYGTIKDKVGTDLNQEGFVPSAAVDKAKDIYGAVAGGAYNLIPGANLAEKIFDFDGGQIAGDAAGGVLGGQVGGISLPQAIKTSITNPIDVAKGAVTGVGKAFIGESDDASSLQAKLYDTKRQLASKALDAAEQESTDPDVVATRAKEIYREALDRDMATWALDKPESAQSLSEIVLDPINVLPVEKAVGAGSKAVGRIGAKLAATKPGAAIASKLEGSAISNIADQFQYLPEAKRISKDLGTESSGALTRMASEEGSQVGAKFKAEAVPLLQRMEKAKDKEGLINAIRTGQRIEGSSFDDAQQAASELSTLMKGYHKEFGTGSRFTKNTLKTIDDTKLKGYVPHKILTEEGEAMMKQHPISTSDIGSGQTTLQSSAAHARKLKEKYYVRDAAEQFKAGVLDLSSKLGSAAEVKKLVQYMGEEGVVMKVKNAGKGSVLINDTPMKIRNYQARLLKDTGIQFDVLNNSLGDALQLVTGKSGDIRRGELFVMPRSVTKRLQAIAPILGDNPKAVKSLAEGINDLMSVTIRPLTGAFKVAVTQGGGMAFTARNLASAVGIQAATLGFKALNPKLQKQALVATLISAGLKSKKALNMVLDLEKGSITIGEIVDILKRTGALNQFELRAGLDLQAKGILDLPRKAATKLFERSLPMLPGVPVLPKSGEFASISAMNRNIDNYQKIVHFISFLKGKSNKDIALALDKMSKLGSNYQRLSPIEKNVIRDVIPFYSWTRYILPMLSKQIINHPDRFAFWAKARGHMDRTEGKKHPGWEKAIPDYLKDTGHMAPESMQPGNLPFGDHKFAMNVTEDPLSMLLQPLQAITGKSPLAQGELGPSAKLMIEMMTGQDSFTGAKIPDVPWNTSELAKDLQVGTSLSSAQAQTIAKALTSPVTRMSKNYFNMYKLMSDYGNYPGDAFNLMMRYKASRDFSIFAKFIDAKQGEGTTLGSQTPGIYSYPVDAEKEASYRQHRIAKEAKTVVKSLSGKNPLTGEK